MTRILLIDDSAFYRQFTRRLLEEAGYEVEDYLPTSEQDILDWTAAWAPQLVVTDYNMPLVDGQAVVRTLRKHSPTLPVVVLTATRDPQREAEMQVMGHVHILHKPIQGASLLGTLKKLAPLE